MEYSVWKSFKKDSSVLFELPEYEEMEPETYAEKYEDNGQAKVRLVIRSSDNSIDCGSRFKYIEPIIDMSYKALVDALNKAIDKAAEMSGSEYVTSERNLVPIKAPLNYDDLLLEFNELAKDLMTKDGAVYGPKITFVVEKYLGKGRKVSESTMAQVELLDQIVAEIKETLI